MEIQQNQKKSVKTTCFLTQNVAYYRSENMKVIPDLPGPTFKERIEEMEEKIMRHFAAQRVFP